MMEKALAVPEESKSREAREKAAELGTGALSGGLVLVIARAVTLTLSLAYVMVLPRFLGDANFGKLTFAVSTTALLALLIEFGLGTLTTRDISRDRSQIRQFLFLGTIQKVLLWLAALVVLEIFLRLVVPAPDVRLAFRILGAGMLLQAEVMLVTAVLQGCERLRDMAVGMVIERAAVVALAIFLLLQGFSFVAIAAVMVGGLVIELAYKSFRLARMGVPPAPVTQRPATAFTGLFRRAIPFFAIVALSTVYYRIDVVMLGVMTTDQMVGWYGAAVRLVESMALFPQALMGAFFPILSRLSHESAETMKMTARKGLNYLVIVGVPISLGIFVLAREIVTFLYGRPEFLNSAGVLRILSASLFIMYVNFLVTSLLVSTDRQQRLVAAYVVAAVLNPALNLLAIPVWGHVGAAFTTLVTEAAILGFGLYFLGSGVFNRANLFVLLKAVFAGCLMVIVLLAFREIWLPALVALGAITFGAAAWLFRALPHEEMNSLGRMFVRPAAQLVSALRR